MRAGWRANRTPGPTQALALALALVGTTCRGGRAAEAPAGASGGPLPWLPVVDEGCPADRFVDVPEVYLVREIFRLKAFTPSCLLYINTFDTLYFQAGPQLAC